MAPISVTYEEAKATIGLLPLLAPRPNASNLRALSQHLEQKLQTIPCHQAPEHGFLGMVMPPAIYALRSDAPWEEWPDPGPHPAAAETTAEQNNLHVVYEANKAVYDSQQNVRRAVTETLNAAVPNAFRKRLPTKSAQRCLRYAMTPNSFSQISARSTVFVHHKKKVKTTESSMNPGIHTNRLRGYLIGSKTVMSLQYRTNPLSLWTK